MTRSVCNTKLGLVWSPSSYIALVFATLVLCVIETVSSSSIDEENRDISPPATTAAGDIALLRTPTPLGIRNKYDGSTLQSNLHHIGPHDPTLLRDLFLPRTRKRLRAGGLRTTELRITPRVVQRGKNVTMSCQFPPHEYGVYSVKWYKGTQEFYRYSPLDTPQIRLLPVNGIKVDRLRSNETHVFLIRVGANISGNYTCEAIHNSHAYPQYMASARLDVVAVGGLRATDLRISPPVVQRGNDTTLACLYELTDAPLYSVKWYRGRHEFYRYSPTENPTTKIFPFAGINVDLARSNQSQVVLTRVSFGLSGNFSCEVTADAPSFATSIVSNTMEVVALPPSLPVIQTDKHYYGPGDVLHANCTSGPSRPPADLIFLLNDQPHDIDAHQVHPAPEGLFRSEIYSSIQLWPAHYERGAPILRCQAKIGDLYKDDAAVALYSGNSHPKIERVTSPGSAGSLQVCQFLLLLHIIVWANNT